MISATLTRRASDYLRRRVADHGRFHYLCEAIFGHDGASGATDLPLPASAVSSHSTSRLWPSHYRLHNGLYFSYCCGWLAWLTLSAPVLGDWR